MSSPPTISAPAASASRTFSPLAMTNTFLDLPSPAAKPPCRAPSGQHAWDRLPGASSSPPSRRTWRTSLSAKAAPRPEACKNELRRRRAPSRCSFPISSLHSSSPTAAPCCQTAVVFATAVWRPQNLGYAVTSIPIERAVPFTLFTAASTDAAFRSGIFCLAISCTCFSVTLPTLSLFGRTRTFRHSRSASSTESQPAASW